VITVSADADAPGPEHRAILRLCERPRSVVEIAAGLDLPIGAAKVLVSDLIERGSVFVKPPDRGDVSLDRDLIRTVIDGVRRL
jgi:predicted ArsR family transcriptional regulator